MNVTPAPETIEVTDVARTTWHKILVVEDFPHFRVVVCSLLAQRPEFLVTEACDGLEAVQKAAALQPDLVLLDIGLPNLNGMEVARRIGKLAPTAKILFLSQESSPDIVRETLMLGALGYIHKSHAGGELLHAIDTVLEGRRFVSTGLELNSASDRLTQTPQRN